MTPCRLTKLRSSFWIILYIVYKLLAYGYLNNLNTLESAAIYIWKWSNLVVTLGLKFKVVVYHAYNFDSDLNTSVNFLRRMNTIMCGNAVSSTGLCVSHRSVILSWGLRTSHWQAITVQVKNAEPYILCRSNFDHIVAVCEQCLFAVTVLNDMCRGTLFVANVKCT